MSPDNLTLREQLLIDRNRRLEATLQAYDGLLNTRAADRMRKRVAELESTLAAISDSGVCKGELGDKVTMILRNKFR